MSNVEPVNNQAPQSRDGILQRIGREIMIETIFVIVCVILALGLDVKVALTVVLLCLKFAIGDFVTAFIVLRNDPSRAHGLGLAFLFIATGMARASQFSFIALFFSACVIVPFFGANGMGNIAALGLGVAALCAYGFLLSIFPLTLFAYIISCVTNTQLDFASGLTKLRRAPESKREEIQLDVRRSINILAIASGISLSICVVSSLFFFVPQNQFAGLGIIALAFGLPFLWGWRFAKAVTPVENHVAN